jgi:signal transduction histidine kinase
MFIKKTEIEQLSADIRRMIDGEGIDIRDNREGLLSILKNDIYTLSNRLNEQSVNLSREKQGMTDALADISHQLKTPLTSAIMMSELLTDDDTPPEKRREFLSSLTQSLEHTERLVLSLLRLAKLDGGVLEFNRESISADELIRSALEALRITLELREQTVNFNIQDVTLICDRAWTAEALSNIIKNASEHSPNGSDISIDTGQNALYSYIAVTDSGTGLTNEQLPLLFERFRSANKRGGIGIGLNMARTIMRGQGGDIELRLPNTFILKFYK